MGRICSTYGESGDACRVLVGKPEVRRTLGIPKRRWKDNIEMDLREKGWGIDWTDLAEERERWRAFVTAVMNVLIL
jgi:hypothetical protein